MTSPIAAPGPGARAGVVEVGDVLDGAARVVLGGTVNDGVDRSASPPTDCEHPATSTDAAIRPAIRITAKASGPTRRRCSGAAAVARSIPSGHARTRCPRDHRIRHGRRLHPRRREPVAIDPVCAAAGGSATAACTSAGGAVAGCAVLPWVRILRTATARVHDPRPRQVPADERGLPDAQRRHAQTSCRSPAAGVGVHPRRRLLHGQLGNADLRRRGPGAEGMCVCLGELPAGRAGMPGPLIVVQ